MANKPTADSKSSTALFYEREDGSRGDALLWNWLLEEDLPTEAMRAEELRTAGGAGSGNFGHVGRPGQVGGSGGGEGGGGGDARVPKQWRSKGGFEHTGTTWKQETDPKTGRPIPIKVDTVEEGVALVHQGLVVEVKDVQSAYTLVKNLADMAREAKAAGKEAKNYDLCQVSVAGTNLFCAETLRDVTINGVHYPNGIPRLNMPQIGGEPVPGSQADQLLKDKDGKVNGSEKFIAYLEGIGMKTTKEVVPSAKLRASQREMIGEKVGGMMLARNIPGKEDYDPGKEPIFVSSDGYVIDGHHRWAAVVGRDAEDGKLGDTKMNIVRVNAPITEVLALADTWATRFGIKQVGGPSAKKDKKDDKK